MGSDDRRGATGQQVQRRRVVSIGSTRPAPALHAPRATPWRLTETSPPRLAGFGRCPTHANLRMPTMCPPQIGRSGSTTSLSWLFPGPTLATATWPEPPGPRHHLMSPRLRPHGHRGQPREVSGGRQPGGPPTRGGQGGRRHCHAAPGIITGARIQPLFTVADRRRRWPADRRRILRRKRVAP